LEAAGRRPGEAVRLRGVARAHLVEADDLAMVVDAERLRHRGARVGEGGQRAVRGEQEALGRAARAGEEACDVTVVVDRGGGGARRLRDGDRAEGVAVDVVFVPVVVAGRV